MTDVSTPAEVRIKLFGGFRQYTEDPELRIDIMHSATVSTLRSRVAELFGDDSAARELLKVSAFATDQRVLDEDDPVPNGSELSLLPPVCGG